MPKDLVDNPLVFPMPVSVPVDGELATGPAFETPYQQLSNRTAYLQAKVDKIGVKRIARAANFTVLRAITDMEALDLRWVDEFGLYWYEPSGVGKEEIPWRIRPLSGVGFWRHMQYGLRTTIDKVGLPEGSPAIDTLSTTFVDAPGLSVTLVGAEVGDRVTIAFHGQFTTATAPAQFRLAIQENVGPTIGFPEATETIPITVPLFRTYSVLRTVATAGDAIAKLQFRTTAVGGLARVLGPLSLVAQIVRP